MRGKHYKRNKYKIINRLLLLVLSIIFVTSLVIFIHWIKSNYNLSKIERKIIEEVITYNDNTNIKNNEQSIIVDFESLKEINKEINSWIYIKNTDINYPILQTTNNEYYLKHDINRKYNSCGSIFMDCNNNCEYLDDNTIIYGHNLKNKKMFADLGKIYNGELGSQIEIEIYTKNSWKKYNVITAYMEEPNLNIVRRNFENEDKKQYIDENIRKSNIKFEYELEYNKNLITLITCDLTGKKRIVITACEKLN